ncbi:MAG TPA: hypothetical protein VGO45_04660 [Bacteroidia bacterium]|jgi:hypothetical protein|nr:hypothetical protein [Bacteroidia bacterium]
MKQLLISITAACMLVAFQSYDSHVLGKYSKSPTESIVMNSDHTFLQTIGDDWRKGMWKLKKDSIIIQDGMYHSSQPGKIKPEFGITSFILKKEGILAGKDLYRKDGAKPSPPAVHSTPHHH